MRRSFRNRGLVVLAAGALLLGAKGGAQTDGVTCFPANKARGVNPDTHLVVTFASPVTVGKAGWIRVYDAAGHKLVDSIDMSVPAGPDPLHRVPPGPTIPLDPSIPTSPTTTTPAVRTTPADLHNYQLTTIGGLPDFHFYPVIVHGDVATIYLHNNVLRYHHRYIVRIDPGVLTVADGGFAGFTTDRAWTFTTKAAGPAANATRVVVAADGSGDFNTVQGAVDWAPDHPAQRVTIFIKDGTYEEIVFFQRKANLTIRGEDRDKVQVGYGDNSAFNPPMPGPNRRCAFSVYDSTGIELENFSVSNYYYGQAEGLLISGSENIVSHMNIKGSGDALNLRGSVYLTETRIIGDGDTILGVGPAFFDHCTIESIGPFMWIRNTAANHGNVFVGCTFIARERPVQAGAAPATTPARTPVGAVLARLPMNHGLNYPYAEAVLIHCKLQGVPAIGWGPVEVDGAHLRLWEFDSTDLDGHPIDTSQRNPASKQLTMPQDATEIKAYSDPAFVLGGWNPLGDKTPDSSQAMYQWEVGVQQAIRINEAAGRIESLGDARAFVDMLATVFAGDKGLTHALATGKLRERIALTEYESATNAEKLIPEQRVADAWNAYAGKIGAPQEWLVTVTEIHALRDSFFWSARAMWRPRMETIWVMPNIYALDPNGRLANGCRAVEALRVVWDLSYMLNLRGVRELVRKGEMPSEIVGKPVSGTMWVSGMATNRNLENPVKAAATRYGREHGTPALHRAIAGLLDGLFPPQPAGRS